VWYKVLPAIFGGQKGIANFHEALAKHIPLSSICSANNDAASAVNYKVLPVLPLSKSQFFNFKWRKKIAALAKKENAAIVLLEHPYHGWSAVFAKNKIQGKLIVHSHNIEYERFRNIGRWWWRLLRSYEGWVHRRAQLNLFKTERDLDIAVKEFRLKPASCMVVPYGIKQPDIADRAAIAKKIRTQYGMTEDEKLLLFAGTLDYTPTAKAVEAIYREIVPRLRKHIQRYRIIICGRNRFEEFQYLNELNDGMVIRAGEVAAINEYFAAADAFINTTSWGGGTQTKNLDALAMDCNVVCFDEMIEQQTIDLAAGKVFTAATGDWQSFVAQIQKATEHTEKTPAAFFKHHHWDRIAETVIAKMASLDFPVSLQQQ